MAYYLAAARVETGDSQQAAREAAAVESAAPRSPLAASALVVHARALTASGAAQEAARLLNDHYGDLPQPDGDLALAAAHEAARELPQAVEYYQRVYFLYPSAEQAARAAAALVALQEKMRASYPPPSADLMVARGNHLLAEHDYPRAHAEFQAVAPQLTGAPRDLARVGMGVATYQNGDVSAAYQYLRALEVSDHDANAERLYYLVECTRRLNDDDEMMQTVKKLNQHHADSPWRFKALVAAANHFLIANQREKYVPLYRAAYEGFPQEPRAATCHWRVTWDAYVRRQRDAVQLLQEHLQRYPAHPSASAALYYLGRLAEANHDPAAARAYYTRLAALFPNHYYGLLARERLAQAGVAAASSSPKAAQFLASISFAAPPRAVPSQPDAATSLRSARARLLHAAGLEDLAQSELRFGIRKGGQPYWLAMEMAHLASAPHQRLRDLKRAVPDYLELSLEDAPIDFWHLLFPLPYQQDLLRSARQQKLDPYLLAGLIRQESEFNPQALSPAHAYGLTQVMPSTGRALARRAGVRRFNNRVLFQPAINLKLGALYLRSLLDQWGGRPEQALAAYNAGNSRVSDWLARNSYLEPAEFVESIPFSETREYVEAVIRNAAVYRRLYGKPPAAAKTARRRPRPRPAHAPAI